LVTGIFENGPADDAGLEIGDLIVEVNGDSFRDINAFNYHLATQGVGNRTKITILRNGNSDELRLDIIAPPETVERDDRTLDGRNPLAGAVVANLSPALAAELRFKDAEKGVIVINAPRRSIARRYGLRTGDIIVRVNGEDVTSTQQLQELVRGRRATWRFAVSRKGQLLETNDIPG
ncbi:MAG: PDZ domain-containing protein, partial [Marinomonas sp.]